MKRGQLSEKGGGPPNLMSTSTRSVALIVFVLKRIISIDYTPVERSKITCCFSIIDILLLRIAAIGAAIEMMFCCSTKPFDEMTGDFSLITFYHAAIISSFNSPKWFFRNAPLNYLVFY